MSEITLHCGDCLEYIQGVEDRSVDLVFTSPPYYNARDYSQFQSYGYYLDFLETFLLRLRNVLKPSRILAINLSCVIESRERRSAESTRHPIPFDIVPIARSVGYKFLDDIIWEKPDGASNRAVKFSHHRRPVAYKPFQITEYILVFKNGNDLLDSVIRSHSEDQINKSLVSDGYERTNIWKMSPERVDGHPAPFPIRLAKNIVSYYSYVDDLVFDPFMGSGTTGVGCVETGRNFVGCEIDPEYFSMAEKRINDARDKLSVV